MFVVSERARDWGTGKLLQRNARVARIEYFDHPGPGGRHLRDQPVSDLRLRKLEPQSRVYFRTDDGHWRAGRVVEVDGDVVEARFSRHSTALIPAKELYVRWGRSLTSPAPFLAAFLPEAQALSTMRRRFLREAILQRAEGAGLEGLLSACVELLPHQMNVVRQVLTDRVQRYLLADEVGLGKTVEAAAIIRQHVIDDPQGHRVAVVVPEALVAQWRDELTRRFHLGPPFLDDSILVVHAGDDELEQALTNARLLVVDEAHNVVGRVPSDPTARARLELIRKACRKAEALLLLSATPAIADEGSFFELMQLIDPEVYATVDREAFHRRIAHRQELAQIMAGFEPGALQFLVDDGKRLLEMFPKDPRLAELVAMLTPVARASVDPEQPELVVSVQAVRQHLFETYRLHRRILRNRRKNAAGLTPARIGAQRVYFEDATARNVARQLENWRLDVAESAQDIPALSALYAGWVRLLLEAPGSLLSAVRSRLQDLRKRDPRAAEVEKLERLQRNLEDWDPLEMRIRALLDAVRVHGSPQSKLVVFCTDPSAADRCFEQLRLRHGSAVVRHDARVTEDPERVPDWTRFMRGSDCWLLVCDASAEEGLNLQGGSKALIHFDLPLAPNRVEQRLGRVDRFGSGDPIRSLVITCTESELECAWADCIVDGFGVMERSIASLQYLVDAQMGALREALVSEGIEAITSLTARLGGEEGEIRVELRRIDLQDELEGLQSEDPATFETLIDSDDDWMRVRDAVEPWLQRGLQFIRQVQRDDRPGVEEIVRYHHGGAGDRGTLLPVGRFRADFLGAIDTELPKASAAHPTTHRYAYRRQTSVNRFTHLMRGGDPLFAGLTALTDADDRGRVDAVWRFRSGYTNQSGAPDLYFRLDILVEADLDPAMALFPDDASLSAQRRALGRRMDLAFAPEYLTIWLDRGLEEVDANLAAQRLDSDVAATEDGGSDTDLDSRAWQKLHDNQVSDALLAWGDLVERAAKVALERTGSNDALRQRSRIAAQRLRAQEATQLARLESRLATLSGRERALEEVRLGVERLLGKALEQGVSQPRLSLDAIGVVFLSSQPLRC